MSSFGKSDSYRSGVQFVDDHGGYMRTQEMKDFCDGVLNAHRTEQQNISRLMVALIHHFAQAKIDGDFDLRNQASVEIWSKVSTMIENEDHLPFI